MPCTQWRWDTLQYQAGPEAYGRAGTALCGSKEVQPPCQSRQYSRCKVNILKRDFETETINQKWCTDITCIHVQKEGWTYLASVMDLCSRKIIGYAYGTSMTAELAVKAVENACLNVRDTKGIILHSDPGSQYTSKAFEDCLSRKEILYSFSRKGNPYDNACIESFHSVLKKEEIYLHTYQDSKEARIAIFEYIEGWYNRKRIHSSIGYLTPQQKEDEELKKAA